MEASIPCTINMKCPEDLFFGEMHLAMSSGPRNINYYSSTYLNTSGDICELKYVTGAMMFKTTNKIIFLHILPHPLRSVFEV